MQATQQCSWSFEASGAANQETRDTAVTTTSHHPVCPAGVGSAVLVRHGVELATTRLDVHNSVHALGMTTDMSTAP